MYVTLRGVPDGVSPADPTRGDRVARTVIVLGLVSMVTDISSEMVNAVLPIYLTSALGFGLLAYGFIDGLYQGVSALVRIGGGVAGDRVSAKWVAVLGYTASAVSRILLPVAQTLPGVTAVITADRLGKGVRTAPRDAMIADASTPENLGRSFGVHRALDTLGAVLGPIVAFVLLWLVPDGYSTVFVVSFWVALVGVAVLVLFVPNVRGRTASAAVHGRDLLRAATAPRLRRPLLAAGALALVTVGDGFLYLSLQQRDDLAAVYFPLLFVGTNLAYFLLAVPAGRLADRIGRSVVFVGGYAFLLLAYVLAAAPLAGLWATLAVLVLLGAFYACTDGVLSALVSEVVADEARGTGIGSAQTVVVLGRFVASLAFGAVWVVTGRSTALLVFGIGLAAAMPLAWWLLAQVRRAERGALG